MRGRYDYIERTRGHQVGPTIGFEQGGQVRRCAIQQRWAREGIGGWRDGMVLDRRGGVGV